MRVHPNPSREINGAPLRVRDPGRGDYLPPEGRHVPRNTYWLRRLSAGDVLEGMPADVSTVAIDVDDASSEPDEIVDTSNENANSFDDNVADLPQNEPEIKAAPSAKSSKRRNRSKSEG